MKTAKVLLVTGGAGFIGSNFIRYMLQAHPDLFILNLDALTYAGNPDNLKDIDRHPRYRFYHGDIADLKTVEEVFQKGIDSIVNFAAESHVDRSITDPGVFVRTNVVGTQVLLDAARRHSVRKYVQVSTDEVYGSLGKEGYFTEETPLSPNSPYSASKAGGDLLVRAYHETYGLDINITRCSNNYGPWQFPEKLIPLMISKALSNEALPVYGDGLNVRDWLYVEDHCRAIDTVLQKGRKGQVYNIGGSNEKTNLEIVGEILKRLNKPESLISFVEDRLGHDRRYAVDSSKIQEELGWSPICQFEEGMKRTIDWYQMHPDWMDRILSGAYMKG